MIGVLASAVAAPVLVEETPADRLARCVTEAEAEAAEIGWAAEPTARADRVAVVVGVPCHDSAAIPSLSYGARDAARVGRRLEAAGFAVVSLATLVTRADLDRALDRAEALLEPGGTLLVYFSGHGVLREEEGRIRRYLVVTDTDLAELPTTAMPVPTLEARVARMPAGTRVVVQDTCFAARPGGKSIGGLVGHDKGLALPEPGGRLEAGDVQLYASRFYEQAIESPELRGSMYTWHLLDGLDRRDSDLDGDGCVGLVEAHEWAARRTEEDRQGFQVPQLRGEAPHNVLLGCTPHGATRAVLGAPAGDSWIVEVSRDGEVVSRGTAALEPGRYRVRLDHLVETATDVVQRRVLSGPLGVRAGEWIDLRDELVRREPFSLVEGMGALRTTAVVPDFAGGLALWGAARDEGHGRPVLGAIARAARGPLLDAGELLARVGWWWEPRRLDLMVGPVAGAGGVVVQARRSGEGGPLPRRLGNVLELGARSQLGLDRLTLALETGLRLTPVKDSFDARWRLDTAPTVSVGLGVRL